MAGYFTLEISSIIIVSVLIITNKHLRKRDTLDSKRIFNIAVLTMAGAIVNMLTRLYDYYFSVKYGEPWFLLYVVVLALLYLAAEMILLKAVITWNLFVDYTIYKSYDHVRKKFRRSLIPCIVLSVIFVMLYISYYRISENGFQVVFIMLGFLFLCYFMQLIYVINAIYIVVRANKGRKPPSFLKLIAFIIPMLLGYFFGYIPYLIEYDFRTLGLAIACVLTWQTVMRRYRYVDPFTGFYNKNFLSSMNEYMEKSGFPNGIGVYFSAPKSEGKLIPVLNSLKPEDAEIFALGEDEYLLMAGPQKESVIRLLIKSIKLKAAEDISSVEIKSSFAIREKEESTEAFTHRLLEFAQAN